jgi:hypothetical protein
MHVLWGAEVELRMRELLADTPPAYRKYLDPDIRAAAELQAQHLGKSEIDEDAMIRAYITVVPRHLRDGLHEILSEHNIDLMYYMPVFDEPNMLHHQAPKSPPPAA